MEINSLEAAFELLARFFQEEGFATPLPKLRRNLEELLNIPESAVFLAWLDAKAIGVATVTSSVGLEYGRSAELEDLYVLPSRRRHGVAAALIDQVCAWCRNRDVSVVLVTVTPEGEARHHLIDYYKQRGFINTKRMILERKLSQEF